MGRRGCFFQKLNAMSRTALRDLSLPTSCCTDFLFHNFTLAFYLHDSIIIGAPEGVSNLDLECTGITLSSFWNLIGYKPDRVRKREILFCMVGAC